MTGRKGRFVSVGGRLEYQARNYYDANCSNADINIREKHLFNKGKKLVAIISEAGACSLGACACLTFGPSLLSSPRPFIITPTQPPPRIQTNPTASSGISLHADRRAPNQRPRVHITLELAESAERAIQQLGRSHRANQSSQPEYRLVLSSAGGEMRFAAALAKRLESLGALTQGDRRATHQQSGLGLQAFNMDNVYGEV